MTRPLLTDLLQVHSFWLMDVAPIDPLALPVLTPLFGFSSISMPSIDIEMVEISEANWFFRKKVAKSASVSDITLTRGVTFYDSDFSRWILGALKGSLGTFDPGGVLGPLTSGSGGITPRRNLMLVQFFPRFYIDMPPGSQGANAISTAVRGGLAAAGAALSGSSLGGVVASGAQTAAVSALSIASPGMADVLEFYPKIPAKAWLLHGCMPKSYKPGSDFDALSSAISYQEIVVSVEMMEEVSLAT